MKRFRYSHLPVMLGFALTVAPVAALASPNPTSAVIIERVYNDCPGSTLITSNLYPASITISDDAENTCTAWANLHVWRFSEDGSNPAQFMNGDVFHFSADLVIDGPGQGEAGLQISPWWSPLVEGRLNIRTTDGEIAAFGGVLPYFNFTSTYGLHYVKGTPIHVEINYVPHSNTQQDPATIEYKLVYGGQPYTSGPLAFGNCTPSEEPTFGCYGILNFATVGGHLQPLFALGGNQEIHAIWSNIQYSPSDKPVAATPTSWGRLKTLYR